MLKKPDDPVLVSRLEKKLNEYVGRLNNKKKENPSLEHSDVLKTGSAYKTMVLGKVLRNEYVDTNELYDYLDKRMGGIDKTAYEGAVNVIDDYINNGGKNTIGGTGY